ncbi:MAG TPA: VWA domain-containing protein [Xanthomonadales bacterium]|nr:VWA domain-containing protein [Xanthomonadales bacterium]
MRRSLLAVSLLVPLAAHAQAAADPPTVMLVLDGSGSMWAQLQGRTKIEIARDAIGTMLDGFEPQTAVGLMAYGHRRKGDCADIEVLAQAAPLDRVVLRKLVGGVVPKGMTPLSAAVKQAAETLKYTEQRATVILLSDGIETCNADPCEVGAALEQAGVEFTAHVVGFDVARQDEGGLRCLANATGGRYFAAADAAQLRDALQQAGKAAVAAPAPPPAPPVPSAAPPPKATITAPATVTGGASFDVAWTGPNGPGDSIGFANPGDANTGPNWIATEVGNPVPMRAPARAGKYELLYIQGSPVRPLARVPIEVTPALATLAAVETVPIGASVEIAWTGPNGDHDFLTIVEPTAGKAAYKSYAYTDKGSPARVLVPDVPGSYEIRYVTGAENEVIARRTVVALPVETSIDAPATAPAGSRVNVKWVGPNNPKDFITVVLPTAKPADYTTYFYTSETSPDAAVLDLPLTPGKYEIRYVTAQTSEILARHAIETTAVTATLTAPATAAAGSRVAVQWTGPNYPRDYITVVEKGAPDNAYTNYFYTGNTDAAAGSVLLPGKPGDYEIRYTAGQNDRVLARHALVATPVTATIEAPATAPKGTRLSVKWTGPNYPGDYITVVKKGAKASEYGSYFVTPDTAADQGFLDLPGEPGAYELRYVIDADDFVVVARPLVIE